MKTKAQIVQELLNEQKITAEDAVILLMAEDKKVEYIFIHQHPVSPYPYNPFTGPYYTSDNVTANALFIN